MKSERTKGADDDVEVTPDAEGSRGSPKIDDDTTSKPHAEYSTTDGSLWARLRNAEPLVSS
jgi:hypothetical protein